MVRASSVNFFGLTALILILSSPYVAAGDVAQKVSLETASEAINLSLNGTCFQDIDANGFSSIDEPGLVGRTIRLLQDGKETANTTTDARGGYIFRSLPPGNYELMMDPVPGWRQTVPEGGSYSISLADKPAYNLDFGEISESKSIASRASREYPIMHPTQEDVQNWTNLYMQAPKAALSPQIAFMLASAPGESYSLLDLLEYMPSERDQGSCGNCWAWAGTGVMEIDLAHKTGIKDRLSVQYLDSNYNGGCYSGACCGGWLQDLASFYSGTEKAIPWSNANAQYVDGYTGCDGCARVSASSISTNPNYPLKSIEAVTIPTQTASKEAAVKSIKNVLRQGKAIWFGYFLPTSSAWSDFNSFWSTKSESTVWHPDAYCGQQYSYSEGGGHAVLCVGYNDTDPDNSYWIMLNSWGDTLQRPHGLFRVDMDMDYGGSYSDFGSAFYWMTLEICYPNDENMSPYADLISLSLNGTCFQDIDASGFCSIDEPGLEGWTIRLLQAGKEMANTTTDARGGYIFRSLPPGNYELMKDPVPGWRQTVPRGGSYSISLAGKPACNLDFGEINESKDIVARASREYPIMHPTQEEVQNWTNLYTQAQKVHLSPQIASMLASAPGESYSLLDLLEYMPSERDQGSCGNCWAWAGTGVMEIDLANQTGIKDRLSVQYLDSNYHGGCGLSGACCGGWLQYLASFYSGTKKAIPWSNANAQYEDGNAGCGGCARVSASSISTNPNYPLTSIEAVTIPTQTVSKEEAIKNIKNVLRQGKAIWFGYFLPSNSAWYNFDSFWGTKSESTVWQADAYCGQQYSYSGGGGHAVLCVGYNDTDPNNSYWVMLNSWGDTLLRPQGLFRVNMDMDYGGSYGNLGAAFYWMTLEIGYTNNENMPPETPPAPDGPSDGYTNHTISFTAATYDPDIDRVKYTFDWGDGNRSDTDLFGSGICASAAHAWRSAGTYEVTVMATDIKGAASNWSRASSINISRPTSPPETPTVPSGPVSGYTQSNYSYTTSSLDPDEDDVRFTFQWGETERCETIYVPSGTKASASHSWALPGDYSVQAMATDSQGISSGWTEPLIVRIESNNPPDRPSKPAGPASGYTGVGYSYNATASDGDGDTVKYTFDWRDGSQSESGFVSSGSECTASHTWSMAGSYLLRVRATDSKGATSGWSDELEVNMITNHPPNTPLAPSGPAKGHILSTYIYSASTSDPEGDDVMYTIDWGDKTEDMTDFVISGTGVNFTHAWQKAGTYYVKVKATDGRAESSWSRTLTVRISGAPNAAPKKPSTPAGVSRGTAGRTYTYTSYSRDPNGDDMKYTFDWGDGIISETGYIGSGKSVRLSHAWSSAGNFRIRVMATDTDGAVSSWSATRSVRISSAARGQQAGAEQSVKREGRSERKPPRLGGET